MRNFFEHQRENLFLYVPFIMAFGAALYFALPFEPHIKYPGIIATIVTCICGAGIVFIRSHIFLRAILLFIFGFSYACAFTYTLATPKLTHNVRNTDITGMVINIDYTPDKTRLFLRINGQDIGIPNTQNAVVRVSMNSDTATTHIGDTIRATMTLFAPSVASAPETFDFARWAYFNNITATGYITQFQIQDTSQHNSINRVRDYLHNKSKSFLSDGLILGYKNAIPENDKSIWTTSGIGHVWSISGFHFALMAGWLFAIFYFVFRLIAPITNRVPARISAMCTVWIMLLLYMAISGVAVATVRAFLMTSLVITAMIMGRSALSLRNICLVFCIVFLINPHFIMQAGFQLSFSAVFGLVWFFNYVSPRMPNNKILKIFYVAVLTTLVATIFTAPFIIAHFYSFPIYGIIGNLVLLPIFSLAIMPLAAIGTMSSVFGVTLPLDVAHVIYNKCLYLAEMIANMPGANINMPHVPNITICIIIFAFMTLVFIRPIKVKINYILFGILTISAIIITIINPRPIFMATADHELVAFEYNNKLEFNKSRAANHFFAFDAFKQLHGDTTDTQNIRHKPDNGVWIYKAENFNLVYIQKFVPLQKNIVNLCRDTSIDYIVSYFKINAPHCHAKILKGGFIIYPSGHVRYTPNNRPWHNLHP